MNEKVLANKQEIVKEIVTNFQESASAIVVEYRGISVGDMTDLRRQLRDEGVDIKVFKNTLVRRATAEVGYQELDDYLVGPNAIAFSSDAVAPSRVLSKFAKKNRKLVIKQGIVEGRVVDLDAIKELASLPNKEGMIAMLLGAIQSPIRQFAYAVSQIEPEETEAAPKASEDQAEVEEVKEVVEETKEVVEAKEPAKEVEETVTETTEEVVEETKEEVKETTQSAAEAVEESVEEETEEPEAAPEVAQEEALESAE